MSEITEVSYGRELPDQVELISKVSEAQFGLLSDVRDILRERAALEREHASKLQVLARKAAEKKAKRMATVIVGDNPTKAWDERTLCQSTFNNAITNFIAGIEGVALDHISLADGISSQVADELKSLERKQGDVNQRQADYFQRLVNDRDKAYTERSKAQQKYYDDCIEFEGYRLKQSRAHDDKHADKMNKQMEQQRVEMLNSKSAFVIKTAITNKVKDRFYSEDIPELENQLQQIQSQTAAKLVSLLLVAQALQSAHSASLSTRTENIRQALAAVSHAEDQKLFVEHNIKPFTPPADQQFEPCQSFYDKGEICTEPEPKVFLQNRLRLCREKASESEPLFLSKQKEASQLRDVVTSYARNPTLGDAHDVLEKWLQAQHELSLLGVSQTVQRTEIEVVSESLGGDEGSKQPHSFKSASFSIPTQCGYCKTSIWGLSKQGKTCRDCNLSVHAKCELKVPAECGVSRPEKVPPRREANPPSAATTAHKKPPPLRAPPPRDQDVGRQVTVVYDFTASSSFELSIAAGTLVRVVEEDDGSGWLKVATGNSEGLIPASYAQGAARSHGEDVTTSPESQGSGVYVKALFDYEAQTSDELSLNEGDMIELSLGSQGGKNAGGGWWEGYNKDGEKGLFPSSYMEEC